MVIPADPGASRIYGIDWANQLPDGVTLASVAWDVPDDLTTVDEDVSGTQGLVHLSGVGLGETYTIVGTATFSNGEVDVRRFQLTGILQ